MPIEVYVAIATLICAIIGGLITVIMNGILQTLNKLNISVSELNIKMGIMIERVDNHEKRLSHLENSP